MVPRVNSRGVVKSVVKAANIIDLLAQAGTPLSLAQMATELSMAKSTLHGLVSTLVDVGYLAQVPETGHYWLGIRLFEIGNTISNQWDMRRIAYPIMQEIVEATGETVHMAVLADGEVLYINKQESVSSIRIVTATGTRLPAHCTGVGKALLSSLSKLELKALVKKKGQAKYTRYTLTDFDALWLEMEKIRKQNYAEDNQEFMDGLRCIAVPIRNHQGTVVSSLSISGPLSRMEGTSFESKKDVLIEGGNRISRELGFVV